LILTGILFSFGRVFIWNFVGILQFLCFMPLWKLDYPLNAL
jgi:hypothetical protein